MSGGRDGDTGLTEAFRALGKNWSTVVVVALKLPKMELAMTAAAHEWEKDASTYDVHNIFDADLSEFHLVTNASTYDGRKILGFPDSSFIQILFSDDAQLMKYFSTHPTSYGNPRKRVRRCEWLGEVFKGFS